MVRASIVFLLIRQGEQPMKVLLQDLVSLSYLSVSGQWTTQVEEVMDFGDVARAVTVAFALPQSRVRVVLHFASPSPDLALPPLPARSRAAAGPSPDWLPRTHDRVRETVA